MKRFVAWLAQRVVQWLCGHHWHPADAMIRWRCCWCDADKDGWPRDGIALCAWRTLYGDPDPETALRREWGGE